MIRCLPVRLVEKARISEYIVRYFSRLLRLRFDSVPKISDVGTCCMCKLFDKDICVSQVQTMTDLFALIRKFVTNIFYFVVILYFSVIFACRGGIIEKVKSDCISTA
jgi:hypothetical protein